MWALMWANLGRKRLRLSLTIASIAVAFILFCLVQALQYAFVGGVDLAGQDRLMTMHKVSFTIPLPRSYLGRISAVNGVRAAVSLNWFGGYYRDEKKQVFSYPVLNADKLMEVYPEIKVPTDQYQQWLRMRSGALIGRALANSMGWKIGDVVPIRSAIFFRKGGNNTWEMTINGIFDSDTGDTNGLYFHYDYFNEGLSRRDAIGWVVLRVKDPKDNGRVAATIDSFFVNSDAETKTSSEKAFVQSFANQFGNITAIVTVIVVAVMFTLLLVTANSMAQSVRERTSEIGILKTLGFTSTQVLWLIMGESLLITAIGGAIGLLVGTGMVSAIGEATKQYLPLLGLPHSAYLLAMLWLLLLGVCSAAMPCWQAYQLKITDALRRG